MNVNRLFLQWAGLYSQAWLLSYEAAAVVFLRMTALACGTAAQGEASRMVQEKMAAIATLQLRAITGSLGHTADQVAGRTLSHYRKKVRANRRRLTKPRK